VPTGNVQRREDKNSRKGKVEMIETFAEYAIAHEAGHAVVGQFVRVSSPARISFFCIAILLANYS
jgi:hypothetical protein